MDPENRVGRGWLPVRVATVAPFGTDQPVEAVEGRETDQGGKIDMAFESRADMLGTRLLPGRKLREQ